VTPRAAGSVDRAGSVAPVELTLEAEARELRRTVDLLARSGGGPAQLWVTATAERYLRASGWEFRILNPLRRRRYFDERCALIEIVATPRGQR
jgi:hypothetical protein